MCIDIISIIFSSLISLIVVKYDWYRNNVLGNHLRIELIIQVNFRVVMELLKMWRREKRQSVPVHHFRLKRIHHLDKSPIQHLDIVSLSLCKTMIYVRIADVSERNTHLTPLCK